ncbi:MAG: trypsin-like peptidase domain-containing protein [Clostridiales bacterium]|jgi:serine protease Do|nr:trypsin-like peptidase domain-containing protein [Clostridiales bacterium]
MEDKRIHFDSIFNQEEDLHESASKPAGGEDERGYFRRDSYSPLESAQSAQGKLADESEVQAPSAIDSEAAGELQAYSPPKADAFAAASPVKAYGPSVANAIGQPIRSVSGSKQEAGRKKEKGPGILKKVLAACLVAILGFGTLGVGLGIGGRLAERLFPNAESESSSLEPEKVFAFPEVPSASIVSNISSSPNNVADIVKKVSDAVVSINVSVPVQNFFNQISEQPGAGSGIIYSEDEEKVYIATNNHVIEKANEVTISVDDMNKVRAKFVGSDTQSDLAVISVSKADLSQAGISYKTAAFGNSEILQVGDNVVAIGNAMGEGKTATSGIISAINKKITIDGKTLDVIQTDAAINPGNSGGALANSNGEIIGINTAKLSSSNVEGMGYSIPSNVAKAIISDLIANGSVQKPFLGIQGMTITDQMKDMYNLPSLGVYITEVTAGGSAEAAGLRATDIIVGYNDEKISSIDELSASIAKSAVGDKVTLHIYRSGTRPMSLEATIGNMNTDTKF